jgi:hypothetical protein
VATASDQVLPDEPVVERLDAREEAVVGDPVAPDHAKLMKNEITSG